MRIVYAACALLLAQVAFADDSEFGRALALGAGRASIESYVRLHKLDQTKHLDWDSAITEFVPFPHDSYAGYVGVFVPESVGTGGGTAYFEVAAGLPGHLFVAAWGFTSSLSEEKRRFTIGAAKGHVLPPGPD